MIREMFCRPDCPLRIMQDRWSSVRTSNSKDSLCSNLCLDPLDFERFQKPRPCCNSPSVTGSTWEHVQANENSSGVQASVDFARCQAALCWGCPASVVCSSLAYCLLIACSLCFGFTWHYHAFQCRRWLKTWTAHPVSAHHLLTANAVYASTLCPLNCLFCFGYT